MGFKYDFSGWATKNDLLCSDGRTIRKDAFKENDGRTVPLVWNHDHNSADNVLGHALLENRNEGVYAYCSLNDTPQGANAKKLVAHGDICSLSIWANKLTQKGGDVLHGSIKEVSLVLAGANPEAFIDTVMIHGEEASDEGIIFTGEAADLEHGEIGADETKTEEKEEVIEHMDTEKKPEQGKTIGEIFNTLTEEQKNAVYAIVGAAVENKDDESEGGKSEMNIKHNVFDQTQDTEENVLSQSDLKEVFADVKRYGSLKDSFVAHGIGDVEYLAHADGNYGINNIDYLFPEAKTLTNVPDFIKREDSWVRGFLADCHHSPFARIKSVHANITADEARARGYVKGNLKIEEVFTLLKRTTTPTTIYKKQKLDRDDVIDITDLDVVAFLKGEMRGMLDEEIARAALVGDQRSGSDEDKINELNIRPIWTDDALYSEKFTITVAANDTESDKAKNFIKKVIKARKDYKGSGNPALYLTEDLLSEMLLITDTTGRDIYDSVDKLQRKLRVSKIVTVPVMENLTRTVSGSTHTLAAILVNLADYNIGADKGGAVNMFDDFDIDYNQMKYLIETRCSGALTKPYSAQVFEFVPASV